MGYQNNGHVTDDVTWPQRCWQAVRLAILATDWLLVIFVIQHRRSWGSILHGLLSQYDLHYVLYVY